ncbi:MAG: queuosine precursor transporter [Pseudomonadota bacterium]|nr:queuosine precursor transporter [Pseudomonadota bacterium]
MFDLAFNQETLWLLTVIYDLGLAILLYRFFGKYGLYTAVVLGIVLGNLQGGKVSELELFGYSFTASMGAILYSGIYFATDVLNEKYGREEANRAVLLGFVANIAVMITLLISIQFKPSNIAGSALEVHNAISTLAGYSPIFVIGSLTAYLISQTFDVWFFHKIKSYTGESKLWLRNNLSTITSQLLDTMIYQFTWVLAGMDLKTAFIIALTKYVFKVVIAGIDTIFIYWVRKW